MTKYDVSKCPLMDRFMTKTCQKSGHFRTFGAAWLPVILVITGALFGCNAATRAMQGPKAPGGWNPLQVEVKAPAPNPTQTPQQRKTNGPTPTPAACVVSNTRGLALNLRACAGMDCTIITGLMPGDQLIIAGIADDWYQVHTPTGRIGWVYSFYCEVKP